MGGVKAGEWEELRVGSGRSFGREIEGVKRKK